MGTCISNAAYPIQDATWELRVDVDNALEPDPDPNLSDVENVIRGGPDRRWLHLHRGQPGVERANVTLIIRDGSTTLTHAEAGIQVRYKIRNVSWTGWLSAPFNTIIDVNALNFDSLFPEDGIFHLTVDYQRDPAALGAACPCTNKCDPDTNRCVDWILEEFVPYSCHVHIRRPGFTTTRWTPVGIDEDDPDNPDARNQFPPDPVYINIDDRHFRGYPANATVDPWTGGGNPLLYDLYVELMAPRTDLFLGAPLWWADPAHNNLPFVRVFPPKHSEDHRDLRVQYRHERFPAKDGPRGVGWMSPYVTGEVDSQGRFCFAETSGRIGYLYPDGYIKTVAGWVTSPDKDPIWIYKQTSLIRQNQVLRGTWLNGIWAGEPGGFHTALDTTLDPNDETIWYVPAYEDNCLWKVNLYSFEPHNVTVSVFVGSTSALSGKADGVGTSARFWGPTSAVFDPLRDVIYMTDSNNGRVVRITRAGVVTTLWGQNNAKITYHVEFPYAPPSVISTCGPNWWFNQKCALGASSGVQVGPGGTPDIFVPHAIRVDSQGRVVLMEHGFGTIRQLDPITNEAKVLAYIHMKHVDWDRGWAWMDVDRWGNAGGVDGIYWCKFVGEVFGERHGDDRGDPGCAPSWTYPSGVTSTQNIWKNAPSCSTTQCAWGGTPPSGKDPPYGAKLCSLNTSSNVFSENYGYIPANNTDGKSWLLFNSDFDQFPSSNINRAYDPPHYPWLVAVDRRGAVLFGGAGENGLARLRKRRATDPLAANPSTSWDYYDPYWQGGDIYSYGTPNAYYGGTIDPSIGNKALFGYDGHGYLGLNDTWNMVGVSDNEMLASLWIPQAVRADAQAKSYVVRYLNAAKGTTSPVRPPVMEWDPLCQITNTQRKTCNTPPNTDCYNTVGTCSVGVCSYTQLGDGSTCQSVWICQGGVCVDPGVTCSSAPPCAPLNRQTCTDTNNVCGPCFPNYSGTSGSSNTQCNINCSPPSSCASYNRQSCTTVLNTCGPCLSGYTGTAGSSNTACSIDCSGAPTCAQLNRAACSTVSNTCGSCLSGYTGIAGPSNVACTVNCSPPSSCASYNRQSCTTVVDTCGPCLSGYTGTSGSSNTQCQVDCATAPNCGQLNRQACSTTPNTCDTCLSGYLGTAGPANTACTISCTPNCPSYNRQACTTVPDTCGPCLSGYTGTTGSSNTQCSIDCTGAPNCAAINRQACSTATNTCGSCLTGFIGTTGPSNAADCVVDCTGAPNCANFNRAACSSTANTCGTCLTGYTGAAGPGNTQCTVDCSTAPNCGTLNRAACSATPNTCGSCLSGFGGVQGDSNTMCTAGCSGAPNCVTLNRQACSIVPNTCGPCLTGYTGAAGNANTACTADCSTAPNCATLNRQSCSATPNTCGSCLSGFVGNAGDSNTQCTVNCASAPNCVTLNRQACSATANTCGSCLSGYTGTTGDANTPCTADCSGAPNCGTLNRQACSATPNTCGSCLTGFGGVQGDSNVACVAGCANAPDCASLHRQACTAADTCGSCLTGYNGQAGNANTVCVDNCATMTCTPPTCKTATCSAGVCSFTSQSDGSTCTGGTCTGGSCVLACTALAAPAAGSGTCPITSSGGSCTQLCTIAALTGSTVRSCTNGVWGSLTCVPIPPATCAHPGARPANAVRIEFHASPANCNDLMAAHAILEQSTGAQSDQLQWVCVQCDPAHPDRAVAILDVVPGSNAGNGAPAVIAQGIQSASKDQNSPLVVQAGITSATIQQPGGGGGDNKTMLYIIIGAAIGGFILLVLLIGGGYYWYTHRNASSPPRKVWAEGATELASTSQLSPSVSPIPAESLPETTHAPNATSAGVWSQHYDSNQGAYYWYNAQSGESRWTSPN